ncbi:MAG: FAD-dependent oxidoreductase [Thioalkalivibrionaceae bacterium]
MLIGDARPRHLLIVGGGLIGLSTAYAALQRGWRITLIEGESAPGQMTSAANGGMLHVSHTEPWNAPGISRVFLRALFDASGAVRVDLGALSRQLPWAMSFLWHARRGPFQRATEANAQLAVHSLATLRRWLDQDPTLAAESLFDASGILKIYRDRDDLDRHARAAERALAPLGVRVERIDRAACLAREPLLDTNAHRCDSNSAHDPAANSELIGGLWYPDDAVGDAGRFCRALTDRLLADPAARVLPATRVVDLRLHRGRFDAALVVERSRHRTGDLTGADTDRSRSSRETCRTQGATPIAADTCVVANGVDAPRLLARLGLRLPIAPVRGYSLTLPGDALPLPLATPLIDDANKIVVTPLGRHAERAGFPDRIRIAGGADIAGFSRTPPRHRLATIYRSAQALLRDLPAAEGVDGLDSRWQPWAGLRPMPARGRPYIGPTRFPGVWINAGVGHLGWTFAAGSADRLIAALAGDDGALAALTPLLWEG